ncbi:MAG: acyl-CoA dehydrogenase family protein [Desulfarculaceae bacterium]|nr:acyl-CoA dehydrogenase family protein [Desulfarculaceae bacterium]MCF8074358.1 acyl-CoA dehydrogenase family protein [Desulfarculaceae bacterium]MCF8103542.1 acyl-CoA dehydrogenase family protein [Desulfarculaceae bacterium]MCF8117309.1 acyl-CoA dehydrogenase family protein [Desulfarculaceae bacterium]
MQYGLTEEQIMLRDTVRRLAQEQVAPGAAERDEKEEFPWDMVEVFKDNGLFACDFKEAYGGAQMGLLAFALAVEEIAKVCGSSSVLLLVHELGSMPMMLAASDAQKEKWFPAIAAGESLTAFGLTEPGAGSDVAGVRTKAVKKGDKYIINGTKMFITHADVADYICIAAITDPDKAAHKGGQSIIVVEKGTPGLSIGKKEHKMGIRASTTCEVILEDCEVPAENLLGSEGDGFHILMKTLDFTRPCVAAQALGIAQGALDFAVDYAKERVQFGKAIIKNQGLAWMLADMDTSVEAARQLVYKTCAMFEQVPKDLSRVPIEAMRLSAMCKLLAGDTAMKVTTDAVQVLGGYGYTREYPVERMMRDAKITQIYEGTSQVQKMVIGGLL